MNQIPSPYDNKVSYKIGDCSTINPEILSFKC